MALQTQNHYFPIFLLSKKHAMLELIITDEIRLKLLFKFFLNKQTTSYLRGLEAEFCESLNAIRMELYRLENAGLLNSSFSGNK